MPRATKTGTGTCGRRSSRSPAIIRSMATGAPRPSCASGWALGRHADSGLALRAWTAAKRWLQRQGWPIAGIIVHHDQDSVYTSYAWTGQLVLRDQVRLSYALDGCRDNTEMESFHSRFKSENRSLLVEAASFAELERIVGQRITYYNRRRRHSALGNQATLAFLAALEARR